MTREEQRRAAMTSLNYPPGTRLELISMGKDPDPVPPCHSACSDPAADGGAYVPGIGGR